MGKRATNPIPMRLPCPACGVMHIDEGEFATKPHHTHACQECGNVWRPAVVPTVGVLFLPGFKNDMAALAERIIERRNVLFVTYSQSVDTIGEDAILAQAINETLDLARAGGSFLNHHTPDRGRIAR